MGRSLVRFQMVSLEFFIDIIRSHYGPGVDSASNRNEYQEYFGRKCGRYVRLTTLPPSWAVVTKSGNLNFLQPYGDLEPVMELIYLYQCFKATETRILQIRLLTPWCRVLLEKLTGLQLVKKFPTFHGTRRFITALISVRHLSLSWASPIQSIYPHPTS